ncbi:hypothetical protein MVES1_002728 [Malassezia vespertilionis]|uniref:Uncharacterized protein n=1 Tax=Malassezia vespertilionis TaxID=2020962 RepID=A0A2N1JB39_9BASI|nr:uncharacterized protein MVES1_002728 [Malassezia vespertilionis]PKI83770.1 hypothetical protein MVES_002576 [Malassezia vespertilionis]WFD07365.1 hypothetical protein MVES1_002728 [Malassezia vespertilionis]
MAGRGAETEERLWSMILDLSAQLTVNKQACDILKQKVDGLQGQAIHAKSGYALRRFNVDLSHETFTSELEKLNAQLAVENTTLSFESKQLGSLLREYELTLETVMSKFRAFSHAAQQYGLDLCAYYETRIERKTHELDEVVQKGQRSEDVALLRLGSLLRDALHVVDGEEEDAESSHCAMEQATEIEQLRAENTMLRSLLGMDTAPEVDEEEYRRVAFDTPAATSERNSDAPAPSGAPIDEVDVGARRTCGAAGMESSAL